MTAGKWAVALYVLHWIAKIAVVLMLLAAAYLSTGCAVLRCDDPSCWPAPGTAERHRAMVERRDAHRERMREIRGCHRGRR